MTTQPELDQAKAALRAYASGRSTRPVLTAAAAVLERLDEMEQMELRARHLLEKTDPGERADAVMENVQVACRFILGETSAVRAAGILRPSAHDNYGPGEG